MIRRHCDLCSAVLPAESRLPLSTKDWGGARGSVTLTAHGFASGNQDTTAGVELVHAREFEWHFCADRTDGPSCFDEAMAAMSRRSLAAIPTATAAEIAALRPVA